jgi:His-Xaa-Ser system protein HxsD
MAPSVAEEPGDATLVDGDIALVLDLRSYRLAAVKKAAYRCARRFTAIIGSPDRDRLPITLRFAAGVQQPVAREAARQFFQELLDQELREQIAEETLAVRTLILAHAFSNVDLIKRGE